MQTGATDAGAVDASTPRFQGPWKMTYASTDPARARDFSIKYLGAVDFGRPRGTCGDIQWVLWPLAKVQGSGAAGFAREASHLHAHFVLQSRRPTGSLSIADYERHCSALHKGLAPHDAFVHSRITLEAANLDPMIEQLTADGIPFLLLLNPLGQPSLFVEVPVGILVEVTSLAATTHTALAKPWSRCGADSSQVQQFLPQMPWPQHQQPPPLPRLQPAPLPLSRGAKGAEHAARTAAAAAAMAAAVRVSVTRAPRFVYACSNPSQAARFAARYLHGQLHTSSADVAAAIGSGACIESAMVRWEEPAFEMVWIRAPRHAGHFSLADEEGYLRRLHGNLSLGSPNEWDAYMDYHAGVLFDDCDPIIRQLQRDGIPFFHGKHGCGRQRVVAGRRVDSCISLFMQDTSAGIVYEAMCFQFSLLSIDNVEEFDQCKPVSPRLSAAAHAVEAPPPTLYESRSREHALDSMTPATQAMWQLAQGQLSEHAVSTNLKENQGQPRGRANTGLHWTSWHNLQDREYMRKRLFPYVGQLVQGPEDIVLDLGVRAYNADDRKLAHVSAAQWYFCDPDPEMNMPSDSGIVLRTPLSNLTWHSPHLSRRFRALIDYGVMGALTKNGKWLRSDAELHALSYASVLAPGGVALLKWDFTLVRYKTHQDFLDDVKLWRDIRALLTSHLYFREEYMQLSPACPPDAVAVLKPLIESSEAEKRLSNLTYVSAGTVPQKCGYSFSRWQARGAEEELLLHTTSMATTASSNTATSTIRHRHATGHAPPTPRPHTAGTQHSPR